MRDAKFDAPAGLAVIALLAMILTGPAAAKSPSVVVSLPPIHSLAAAVMGDTGTPHLMLRGGRSPHDAALRPSDLKRLNQAALVVWVGATLETFLAKPMTAIKKKTAVLTLLDVGALKRHARRKGRAWEAHDHHDHGRDHEAPRGVSDKVIDPHLWLSPHNAIAIARAISAALSQQDPASAAIFKANTDSLVSRIHALETRLGQSLAPVRKQPYLVFHDAYQYFERHFGLSARGAISINPERRPGARRIAEIRRQLTAAGIQCVFREPQFAPGSLGTITKGTGTRIGILDPLGAAIPPGPGLWFTLMSNLGESLTFCLGAQS